MGMWESDAVIVPLISGNAEEGKDGTQSGLVQGTHLLYTGIGAVMATKLGRIREMSATNPNMVFTSLYHLINEELLRDCHRRLDGSKATGVDQVTKAGYDANLGKNLEDLVIRLKRKNYKPQASLRVFIPKVNGKLRPLGMASYEDKLVQSALGCLLSAVFEPKFRASMFGYRPNLNCHGAIKELNRQIERCKTNYVVEADIKGFFNNMEHDVILDLIKFRISDPNVLWLTKKTLTAGVIDGGKWHPSTTGTEQGNLASPVIANIYMHYALALWFDVEFSKECKGECGLVIYADDFVATFQYKEEATKFLTAVKERFARFGLELEPSKTKLVEFGRFAEQNRNDRGDGKPETFDFLGFTHICSKNAKHGKFEVKRITSNKKQRMKLKEMNLWLKHNRSLRVSDLIKALNRRLRGYYQYYGISGNIKSIADFHFFTQKMLFKWLNRRSQRRSYSWDGFNDLLKVFPLERPRIHVNLYR
jgi:group II intron reverse transcriptase/maturase